MKAMILAAGMGTRLQPLTNNRPKALVPFRGMSMLERVIRKIYDAGISEIVVNIYHFPEQVEEFVKTLDLPGLQIHLSDERDQLMETGGGILKARPFLDDGQPFLVHNVDVYTNLDIRALISAHKNNNAFATIAVKKRDTSRSLLFDKELNLAGWKHNETAEMRMERETESELQDYGNSCVQVISGDFFSLYPEQFPVSLTAIYLEQCARRSIKAFIHDPDYWYDLGRYELFLRAEKESR